MGRPAAHGFWLAIGLGSACAHADIYAFTDSAGVMHLSNVPTDSRYSVILEAPRERPAGRTIGVSRLRSLLRPSARFDVAIDQAAGAATVSPALVRAVITVESGFNPQAVSSRGARGLMQLRPATARHYGVSDVFDPSQNIRGGVSYLKDLLVRFDSDLELALAAYNAGEDAVERYGRHIPPYPETLQYVPRVMTVYRSLLAQTEGG
jgi:soluble lytic murein transglycosylase-like protein